MFNFKTIFSVVVACILVFATMSCYYGGKLSDKDNALRTERERNAELVVTHNEEIGQYTTTIARQESNLKDAATILEKQRKTIRELENELDARVEVINALTVQIDSLESSGTADIIVVGNDSIKYTVKEHKQGVLLDLELQHPSGDYKYTMAFDPLEMELYLSKEKSGVKVGSIVFPTNPNIHVTKWDIFYDPDTRPWYKRIWDDVRLETGVFAGADLGLMGLVGYKSVMAGPVVTSDGASIGIMYRIK